MKVAAASNESNAQMMEGMLKDAGILALIQRAPGFNIPDFLSAGPSDLLVPDSSLEEARQIFEESTGLGSYVP